MRRLKVSEYASDEHVKEVTVKVNKGGESRPELRTRLVIQETKRVDAPHDAASVFAGTPPLFKGH